MNGPFSAKIDTIMFGLIVLLAQTVASSYATGSPYNPRIRSSGHVTGNATYSRWDPLPSYFGPFLRFSGREGNIVTYSVLIGVSADSNSAIQGRDWMIIVTPYSQHTWSAHLADYLAHSDAGYIIYGIINQIIRVAELHV